MRNLFLVAFWLMSCSWGFAQFNSKSYDTTLLPRTTYATKAGWLQKTQKFQRAVVVPIAFVGAGLLTIPDKEFFLSRNEINEERQERFPHFHTHVDDYLQYAPIAAVYGLNLAGVKGKTDFANRTAILIKTELIVTILTSSLKRITAVPRPDTGSPNSFPSGHTAQAFAAATFMAKEYKDVSIWYPISAYTMATAVGTLRVMNNRHWVSDVLAGAGIGIFSTNLAYLTHRYRWGKKNKGGQTLVVPSYDGQAGMVSVVHSIKYHRN